MMDTQLTKDFNLMDFVRSGAATKNRILEQFNPPAEVVNNLKVLCEKVLQPLQDSLPDGKIYVSSGYRCERLNDLIGGKKGLSQHLLGKAADIKYLVGGDANNPDNLKITDKVQELNLPFDQMIAEKCKNEGEQPQWVHISYNEGKNRKQFFRLT